MVSALAERPGTPIEPGIASGFATGEYGIMARFDANAAPESARVVFPKQSNGRVRVEDTTSGAVVDFRIRGARTVDAESGDGYVVYRGAHESGATLLHRALPSGTEDYVAFDARPAAAKLTYDVALGPNVAGLRLVEGSLEMIDADGAPRLRVEPPFLVDAGGARIAATLAVEGCEYDKDPSAPWGREVTPPGAESCDVSVTWPDTEVHYPAVLDPRWTTTGSMTVNRQDHTATLLSTGKVLVAGGRSGPTNSSGLNTAELFDRTTGTWAATGSMTGGRFQHTATQLGTNSNTNTSGKVLVMGGITANASINTAELYAVSGTGAGTWSAAATPNGARNLHTATLLASGKVLFAGGANSGAVLGTASLYDPTGTGTGSWSTTGAMQKAVRSHTATLLQVSGNATLNNKVLVVGGDQGGGTSVTNVQLFDGTSTWTSLTALLAAREAHTATALANGNVLIAGGLTNSTVLGTSLLFSAASGSGSWGTAVNMTSARQGHTATLLPSTLVTQGQVLVTGGVNTTGTLATAELWTASSNTWATTTAMPAARQVQTATLLSNNMVLLTGGNDGTAGQKTAALYDASFALACTSASQCASGFCAQGFCCDTACTTNCGACNLSGKVGTCSAQPNTTVCRAANGTCDVAEKCDGTSLTCPADGFVASGTTCRNANGICDVAEKCTGTSAACPADGFAANTTVCRPAVGACDAPENCTGTSATCPADVLVANGIVCRATLGTCDVAERCNGTSAACPADQFAAAGTVCTAATGNQGAETCTGTSVVCPESAEAADVFGFETVTDWAASNSSVGSVVGLNPTHTQGTHSLEVFAHGAETFVSNPVTSVGSGGTLLLVDVMLPVENPPNPSWTGSVDVSLNSTQLIINNDSAGHVSLIGVPHGQWETLAFTIPAADAGKISAGGYSDLRFSIVVTAPTGETGHFLLDNLRVVPDIVPTFLGVATDSAGVTKAVFDYTTTGTSTAFPYGEGNALLDSTNQFISSPTQAPPQVFMSEAHAPFVIAMTGQNMLTWRVGSHSAIATNSPTLTTTVLTDGTKDATLPDGRKVNLDSIPPQDPAATATAEPVMGPVDNGVLTGTLQITPSGAAVYTVPIVMPPGVAGMAPNLNLVYNSQGANGIMGQGWSLTGLSIIHKCPRTKQQDGVARPVMMDADPTLTSGNTSDGICLDGQRMFENGSGTYVLEKKDFSTITYFPSDNHFEVKTKAGETRYYGLTSSGRVPGNGINAQNQTTTATAIWALQRVADGWGNFFYLHYNQDSTYTNELADFGTRGFIVTEIDYTGHMNASGTVDTPPFASIKFGYDPQARADIRWTRFAQTKIPINQRIKTITTGRGVYTLNYGADNAGLISELQSIQYCTGTTCLQTATFGWTGNIATWKPDTTVQLAYSLPSQIPMGHGLLGTQFIDLDGDGLNDLVYNGPDANGHQINLAWLNDGTKWNPAPTGMALPAPLAGARFADMDGDGILDFVVELANVPCGNALQACPGVWLNRGGTWEPHPEYSTLPTTSTFATVQPINFDSAGTCDQNSPAPCESFGAMTFLPATLVDVNGDGKMDIVRVEEGGFLPESLTTAQLEILVNQGPGSNPAWVRSTKPILTDVALNFASIPAPTLTDLNRDGFPDLISEAYSGPSGISNVNNVAVNQYIALNQSDSMGVPQFAPTLTRSASMNTGSIPLPFGPQIADVDGDGLYDEVLFGQIAGSKTLAVAGAVGFAPNDGTGPRLAFNYNPPSYLNELADLIPDVNLGEQIFPEDFAYALADLNGDGLPDFVLNHYNCFTANSCIGDSTNVGLGGGQVFYNTGATWGSGADRWHRSAGSSPVPGVVPSAMTAGCGGTFVDLNGDGIVDFLQEEGTGAICNGSKVGRGAWINGASPPVITNFPNGRAVTKTVVSYRHITEPAAHTQNVSCDAVNANAVYCDDAPVAAGTKKLAVPINVAWKVTQADGTGNSSTFDTTYAYHSLRADLNGRGPLGFAEVLAYNHASGVKTDTTYLQPYPYTGMASTVTRTQVTQANAPITSTATTYCDTTVTDANGRPTCTLPGSTPAQGSLFVYPLEITDMTALKHDLSANQLTTDTTYRYDTFGNAKQVVVTTSTTIPPSQSPVVTSSITITTVNQYGTSGSEEEKQGKVTDVQVTGSGDGNVFLSGTSHHTTLAYVPVSTFGGASSTARALAKKEVEPGAGWPLQEDTAYRYDQFGNVITTTNCAIDFGNCSPGAVSSLPVTANQPQFRTTTVSYNPSSFNAPAGPGLISSLSYGNGRFPVQTITVTTTGTGVNVQHIDYSAYDPVKGLVLQKTGPNGLTTCYTYDDLGRPTSDVARCGSNAPIVSTTAYFDPSINPNGGPPALGTPNNATVITVARSASGTPSWAFSDANGNLIKQLTRSFDGHFIETLTNYNALGQVTTATKPLLNPTLSDPPPAIYQTSTIYDGFNRVQQVTEDLGPVGSSTQLITTTTYDGLSMTTSRIVGGNPNPQTRTETKNALGKVGSVVDSLGSQLDYQYDPDGNLLGVQNHGGERMSLTFFDTRGRKTKTVDEDLGVLYFTFDGFGDLVSRTDANGQFAMAYDQLGRMLTKQNLNTAATAQWIYDTAGGAAIGKLAAMISEADTNFKAACGLPAGATVSGGNRAVKTYAYTAFGDLQAVAECSDGDTFQTAYENDAIGRQSLVRYPAVNGKQLAVRYHYTGLGDLQYLGDESSTSDYGILWQAKAMDAFGRVTDEQARNGVETVQTRSPGNGWLTGSVSTAHADGNTAIQNWGGGFDEVGNLTGRSQTDPITGEFTSEGFSYDALNRLTSDSVTTPHGKSFSEYDYDGYGNITQKDGNTYAYDGSCFPYGLHRLCSLNGGPTFVYDGAGNLTNYNTRTITYNAHNKAIQMSGGGVTVKEAYGGDDNRVVQIMTDGTTTTRTVYVGLGGTGKSMFERVTTTVGATSGVQYTNFIYAGDAHGGNAFAVRVMGSDGSTTSTRYLTFDHLGSTTAVSDEKGHIASETGSDTQLLGYDPWGARRQPDQLPPSMGYSPSPGNRDFTGQETIPTIGLINMNGRVYDFALGRFLSPDPVIQAPDDLQNWNRYSYALNNPLRYTDPTGYDFWGGLEHYFSNPANIVEFVTSIAICGLGTPVMCAVLGATYALMNATSALLQGASFQQTALNIGIGFGIGLLTSGVVNAALGPSSNPIWGMIAGSASAALTTAITDRIAGRPLGWDVFWSAEISFVQSAATLGLQQAVAVSQASAQVKRREPPPTRSGNQSDSSTDDNVCSDILMKRRDIRLLKGDYGHWWVEIENDDGTVESYGWWPKHPFIRQAGQGSSATLWDVVTGTDGELNAQSYKGDRAGTPTNDPHQGDPADTAFNPKLSPDSPYTSCSAAAAAIREFAQRFQGGWSYPFGWNCHSFQEEMMSKIGLDQTNINKGLSAP